MRKQLVLSAMVAGVLAFGWANGGWAESNEKTKDGSLEKSDAALGPKVDGDKPATLTISELEALNNRLKALESGSSLPVKVHALLQFWYSHASNGVAAAGGVYATSKGQWDSFSFKRGQFFITSDLGNSPKLSFWATLDPTQASFNGLGVANLTPLTTGNVNPFTLAEDLYGKVAFSPYAAFIFGQNKFAQDLEGRTATKDLDFNNYSNIGGGSFGNKRDAGVQLMGTKIPIGSLSGEYVLSVIQGTGQSTFDTNVDKDIAARVGVTYDNNLFLGASDYEGWEIHGRRDDFGLEGTWAYNGFKAQAEYLQGHVNTGDNFAQNNSVWTVALPGNAPGSWAPAADSNVSPAGYYFLASYRYQDYRLGLRWDGYNINPVKGFATNNELDTFTVGFDWFQSKDSYKLSVNWEDHLGDGKPLYNLWTIQSQLFI